MKNTAYIFLRYVRRKYLWEALKMAENDIIEETRKPSQDLLKKCKGDTAKFCREVRQFSEELQKNMKARKTPQPKKAA